MWTQAGASMGRALRGHVDLFTERTTLFFALRLARKDVNAEKDEDENMFSGLFGYVKTPKKAKCRSARSGWTPDVWPSGLRLRCGYPAGKAQEPIYITCITYTSMYYIACISVYHYEEAEYHLPCAVFGAVAGTDLGAEASPFCPSLTVEAAR